MVCEEKKKALVDITHISTPMDDIGGNVRVQYGEIKEMMRRLWNVESIQNKGYEESCMLGINDLRTQQEQYMQVTIEINSRHFKQM